MRGQRPKIAHRGEVGRGSFSSTIVRAHICASRALIDSFNLPTNLSFLLLLVRIFKGKVLKDDSTLDFYGIGDCATVHMVKSAVPAGGSCAPAPAPAPVPASVPAPAPSNPWVAPGTTSAAPAPASGAFGGNDTMANLMQQMQQGGMGGMGGDMNSMQQQLMNNPEMMRSVMNSPMMEGLMSNPDTMMNMMQQNPE